MGGARVAPPLPERCGLSQEPESGRDLWRTVEPWIFLFVALLPLIPLWSVRHFPSQDGPLHLYNAVVFRDYGRGDRQLFRQFFLQNHELVPNWVCPHVLPLLLRFVSPEIAEKAILSAYLLLFPLSVRYSLNGVRKHAGRLAIAAMPFVPNQFYHMGFQDFCLSLPCFFFTFGFYLRHRRQMRYRDAGNLAVLLLVTYITHLLSAVMLLPAIGLCSLFIACKGWKPARQIAGELLPVVLAFVPITLVTLFFILQPHPTAQPFQYPKGWTHRLYFMVSWMRGLDLAGLAPATIVFGIYAIITTIITRQLRRANLWHGATSGLAGGLLAAMTLFLVIFLVSPDYLGGGAMLLVRLAAYPFFLLLLWWAAVPMSPAKFRQLQIVAAGLSIPTLVFMLALNLHSYIQANRCLADFDGLAAQIPANSTLLPIHFENFSVESPDNRSAVLATGVDPFRHAASLGLGERGVVDLGNEWASTDHQSLRWQQELRPFSADLREPAILDAYTRRTGMPIDYVVLWTGGLPHDDLEGRAYKAQLKQDYQLIYTSPGDGYLQLYRHKDEQASASASGN